MREMLALSSAMHAMRSGELMYRGSAVKMIPAQWPRSRSSGGSEWRKSRIRGMGSIRKT